MVAWRQTWQRLWSLPLLCEVRSPEPSLSKHPGLRAAGKAVFLTTTASTQSPNFKFYLKEQEGSTPRNPTCSPTFASAVAPSSQPGLSGGYLGLP